MPTRTDFRGHIRACGSDGPCYGFPGGKYALSQNIEELNDYLVWLSENAGWVRSYLEIGIGGGGMPRMMSDVLELERVDVVDDGSHHANEHVGGNLNAIRNKGIKVRQFEGSSHSWEARSFLNGQDYDLVLIDGDHSYVGVAMDCELVLDVTKPGALIVFHDVVSSVPVGRFLDGYGGGEMVSLKRFVRSERDVPPLGIEVYERR